MIKARKKVNGLVWRSLLVQPVALFIILIVALTWRNATGLNETERVTPAPAQLQKLALRNLNLTAVSAVVVLALAIPIGTVLTRKPFRRLPTPAMVLANIGQTALTMNLVVLSAFWLDFEYKVALTSLVVYALLPILKNTMVDLRTIDPKLAEAARSIGVSSPIILTKVEFPLAVPIMLAGIHTALVLLVGSATLATFAKGGGLGLPITTGVNLDLTRMLVFDSLLVTVLALAIDQAARVVEFISYPKGL